ncbi:hypothetical protein EJ04DRAFT_529371 [Polyplosphaeria fusca]|uniref:Uncharacterized protein n=1 Tax=Polyplosphaeria fusca TaxID=682080 RepID=A0A9P4UW39_9PLEO|nr:hypothetical protein EJ04DRAFT_529371 [Polyplosphaeria fusca]
MPLVMHKYLSLLFWAIAVTIAGPVDSQHDFSSFPPNLANSLISRSEPCNSAIKDLFPIVGLLTANDTQTTWVEDTQPPICMDDNKTVPACENWTNRWNQAVLNYTELPKETQAQLDATDLSIVLDRSKFCALSFEDISSSCSTSCSTGAEKNDFLRWINRTCIDDCGFSGMPSNWKQNLTIDELRADQWENSTTGFFWAQCLDTDPRLAFLDSSVENCTRNWIPHWVPNCTDSTLGCYTSFGVDMDCLCSTTNTSQTIHGHEDSVLNTEEYGQASKYEFVRWIDSTCRSDDDERVRAFLRDDILPPGCEVRPVSEIRFDACGNKSFTVGLTGTSCLKKSKKLGAFAINNVFVVLAAVALGRRATVKRLSCGYLGNMRSQGYLISASIMIVLNIASNLISASIVRQTTGYGATSLKDLFLLWSARPRSAWVTVLALPIQRRNDMYVSSTASVLTTELVLEFFTAYTMGRFINYGDNYGDKKHGMYASNTLPGYPHRKDAVTMYQTAAAWLVFAMIAFGIILWSIWSINRRILVVSRRKPRHQDTSRREKKCKKLAKSVKDRINSQALLNHFPSRESPSIQTLVSNWNQLAKEWAGLHNYVEDCTLAWPSTNKITPWLRRKSEESNETPQGAVAVQNAVPGMQNNSHNVPNTRRHGVEVRLQACNNHLRIVKAEKECMEQRWTEVSQRLDEHTDRLARIDSELAFLIEQLESLHQSDTRAGTMPVHFAQYRKEASERSVRSRETDDAFQTQQSQREDISQTAKTQRLQVLLQSCGVETDDRGEAGQWKRCQMEKADVDTKTAMLSVSNRT